MVLIFLWTVAALCNSCAAGLNGSSKNDVLIVNSFCSKENFNSSDVFAQLEAAVVDEMHSVFLDVREANSDMANSSVNEIEVLLDGLLEHPPELAVIHPGCDSTSILADISKYFKSVLVSYSFSSVPTAPHINHLRMLPSETHLAGGVASLLKYFGWKRIVVLSDSSPIFTSISGALDKSLDRGNVSVTEISLLHEYIEDGIEFPADNRIFLVNAFPDMARIVLCEGWRKHMRPPSYVWITYEWHGMGWWGRQQEHVPCTYDEMKEMMERTLVVSHYPTTEEEKEEEEEFNSNYERLAYDAILALSALVDQSNLTENEHKSPVTQMLDSIAFDGASGPVSFRDGIRQLESVRIRQYRNSDDGGLKLTTFAKQLTGEKGNLTYLPQESNFSIWNTSGVPEDGTPLTVTNIPLLPLMVFLYTYATAGIVFAVVCLIFNIVFRNKKLVRLTSPNLNYIIIFGAIVFYCSTYTFFYVRETSPHLLEALCNVRMWLVSLGFSLCYGPINAKMWRVYHICRKPDPSMKKTFIRDKHLMMIVAIFVAADVVMLSVVTALASARYMVHSIRDKEHPADTTNDEGITVTYRANRCYSDMEIIWLPFVIGYKIVLQAIGAFLAFSIRNINIKGLNDSKEISVILYITTLFTFVIIVVNFTFGDYINVDATVYGFGISTATTCVLAFIFIPKMVALYKDPKGENIFSTVHGVKKDTMCKYQSGANDDRVIVMCAMEKRIKELEFQLTEQKKSSLDNTITSLDTEKAETPSLQAE